MLSYLQSLDAAWVESLKVADYQEPLMAPGFQSIPWTLTALVVTSLCFFLFFYKRIALASALSFEAFANINKLNGIKVNQTYLSSVNIAAALCIPTAIVLIYLRSWTGLNIPSLCLVFGLYLLFRYISFPFLIWFKGHHEAFENIKQCGHVYLIVGTLVALVAFFLPVLFGEKALALSKNAFIAIYLVSFLFYLLRVCKFLIKSDFSFYFCFLYLCVLELLPLGLLVSAISTL